MWSASPATARTASVYSCSAVLGVWVRGARERASVSACGFAEQHAYADRAAFTQPHGRQPSPVYIYSSRITVPSVSRLSVFNCDKSFSYLEKVVNRKIKQLLRAKRHRNSVRPNKVAVCQFSFFVRFFRFFFYCFLFCRLFLLRFVLFWLVEKSISNQTHK